MDILRPYSKIPEQDTTTILIVGAEGTGKHTIAKALVTIPTQYAVQVRTAKYLPLPPDSNDDRPEIDFVVFVVDLANQISLETVKSSVSKLDPRYFIGKACFAVTGVDRTDERSTPLDAFSEYVESYNSPMICDDLTEQGCLNIARKVLKLAETAAGFQSVSPLLVQCTRRSYATIHDL